VATQRLAIHLLGEFRVSVGARAIEEREWRLRKAKRLVKLLALAPRHRLHREHVIDRLWPDLGPEDGANNLHRALYVTRRTLEPDLPPRRASSYLRLRHDLLVLEAPGGLWIDVEAFLAAAREAHEDRTPRPTGRRAAPIHGRPCARRLLRGVGHRRSGLAQGATGDVAGPPCRCSRAERQPQRGH
jgi:hypothetical protein